MFLQCLPIYWVYKSFRVICTYEMPWDVENRFERLWFISSLDNHLSTYEKLDMAIVGSFLWCSLLCMGVGVRWHNHVIMLGHHSTNMVWCG